MTEILWQPAPDAAQTTQLGKFMVRARERAGAPAATGDATADWLRFHAWSVARLEDFWRLLLDDSGVLAEGPRAQVSTDRDVERARWFPGLRLSYAENVLRGDDAATAILEVDEDGSRQIERGELRRRVAALATAFGAHGIGPGDRVVAVARNRISTVVACLAAAAVGATWSACSPDMGEAALLDRFGQLRPTVLCYHAEYPFQGRYESIEAKLRQLVRRLPSLQLTIALEGPAAALGGAATALDELAAAPAADHLFGRFPFDQPLFVLFSSGTTGRPKCIVHGAGGTLLAHLKEHRLHCDLGPGARLFFQTTCGWMMWNWTLSALATGAAIALYDGAPTHPRATRILELVPECGLTHLGTSPTYLNLCRGLRATPRDRIDFRGLRCVLSTGSILADDLFRWVRDQIAPVQIASISGGTDIVGCFALGNPLLPVRAGELQCLGLGLDVAAQDPDRSGVGELVCRSPFPNRPLGLLDDPDGEAFHAAYFAQHEGVWTHGDLIEITADGAARIRGRSDGVMNIRGVRIGPAEIYRALEDLDELRDCCAVERRVRDENELWLLVALPPGRTLDGALRARIKTVLKDRCSHVHVPAQIRQLSAMPYTHSGKKSERAVRDVLAGRPAINRSALRNPDVLDELAELV